MGEFTKRTENLVGQTVGRCRLIAKLGSGGMGSVYLAEHEALGRKVAVKILPADMSRDSEYVARFRREAMTAGRLEHPNIVPIYDVGSAGERHFIVMQFVDGESLSTAVDALGAMEPHDAARMVVGILRGLHHAHEHGVIHRDVKPENVILATGNQPKLLDFGLAIETEGALHLTRDGLVVGTPYYISPEQAQGHRATPRSDIYSAGVVLYFLLTGQRPFQGATALAVLNKHIREEPVPPHTVLRRVPRSLSDIALKMMSKRPEGRYATASAAADDLERFLVGLPVQARTQRRIARLVPVAKVTGALAAGVVVAVIIFLLAVRSRPPEGGPVAAAPPSTAGAVPPAISPAAAAFEDVSRFQKEHEGDFAAYSEILRRWDAAIEAHRGTVESTEALRQRSSFLAAAEDRAREIYEKMPRDKFPEGLLGITKVGEAVRRERETAAVEKPPVPAPVEPAAPDVLMGTLRQEYDRVRAPFAEALVRRETEAAYRRVVEFIEAHPDEAEAARIRAAGVDYGLLLSITPDSNLSVDKLGDARLTIAMAWPGFKEGLACDILRDLQDAIDLRWLIRRMGQGLERLSRGGEVTLPGRKATGRIKMGVAGHVFMAPGAPEQPMGVSDLHPLDLVALAAAADDQPARGNAVLCRAAGVACLYSDLPERYLAAAGWFARAEELKAPGPPGRSSVVADLGRGDVMERLARARSEAASGRFDAARGLLEILEAQTSGIGDLQEETRKAMSEVLARELAAEFGRRDFAGVKDLARRLRNYPEPPDPAAVRKAYHRAMFQTGTWSHVAKDQWSGGAGCKDEGHEGWRLPAGGRLVLDPAEARRLTGLVVQLRLNKVRDSCEAGIRFDVHGADRFRTFAFSALQVAFGENGRVAQAAPLAGKLRAGQWMDLAFVAEDGDLVGYVDGESAIAVRAVLEDGGAVELFADTDVNFRAFRVRR